MLHAYSAKYTLHIHITYSLAPPPCNTLHIHSFTNCTPKLEHKHCTFMLHVHVAKKTLYIHIAYHQHHLLKIHCIYIHIHSISYCTPKLQHKCCKYMLHAHAAKKTLHIDIAYPSVPPPQNTLYLHSHTLNLILHTQAAT